MNNCCISSDLTHSVFHIFYINVYYILILLSNFKYGYGIKSNNSVARQPEEQGQGDLNHENIGIGNLEVKSTTPTIVFVDNSSLTTVKSDADYHIPWPNQMNTTITGFYVFAGLSAAIIFYFVFKALRLRRRRSKVRRYGVLASREDVEMTPLGDEDEDEDSTVFDINEHSRS